MGRRATLREATTRDIKAAALAHLRSGGAVGLSLRAVARDAGISAPGLYRYFDSRDALLTALIVDAFDDLADHLLVATGRHQDVVGIEGRGQPAPPLAVEASASPGEQLRAVALAYHGWSTAHPQDFALVFGDPIPGYSAPVDGPTTAAMQRVGDALGHPVVAAWQQGMIEIPASYCSPQLTAALAPMSELAGTTIPPELAALLLNLWGRLHGPVALEVFGQHSWLFPTGASSLFEAEVEVLLDDLGLS